MNGYRVTSASVQRGMLSILTFSQISGGKSDSRRLVVCQARRRRSATSKQKRKLQKDKTNEDAAADESAPTELSDQGKPMGWSFLPADEEYEAYDQSAAEKTEEEVLRIDMTNPARSEEGPLPEVTRSQVLSSCLSVSGTIFVLSFLLRSYAAQSPDVLGNDPEFVQSLLSLTPRLKLDHVVIALIAVAVVSGARIFLYQNWREFAVATNRSNQQVLTPLSFGDLFVVSFIPGISEEMLFRGGLIPALFADWRGVLIAGVIFGALHNSGGRNVAFAAWASAVGCLYGFAFLLTQDIYVPIFAHSFANLFSAMYWISTNSGDDSFTKLKS